MPRNKVILSTLYKSKDVEIFGSGFRKVYTYCRQSGTVIDYRSGYGGFSFMFYRNNVTENVTKAVTEKACQSDVGKKYATDVRVLSLLTENPAAKRDELAAAIGKTPRTIQRALDKLTSEGKIRRIGSSRAGYWEVIK